MKRTCPIVVALAVGLSFAGSAPAGAQTGQQYGARVGNAYLPSSHDSNCSGIICNALPLDPGHPSQVLPPPPCEGLLCGVTPYSMQPPHTAAEAAAVEQQRAAAAAAAPPPAPAAPVGRHARKHRKSIRAATVAPRTPAPTEPVQ